MNNNTYMNFDSSETVTSVDEFNGVKIRNISLVEKFLKRFVDIIAGLFGIILEGLSKMGANLEIFAA